jgi:hypothetical protein
MDIDQTELQDELWIEVLLFVDLPTLVCFMCVNRSMHKLADSEIVWKLRTRQHFSPNILSRWPSESRHKDIYKYYVTKKISNSNWYNCGNYFARLQDTLKGEIVNHYNYLIEIFHPERIPTLSMPLFLTSFQHYGSNDEYFYEAKFALSYPLRASIDRHLSKTCEQNTCYSSCLEFFRGRTRSCRSDENDPSTSFYIVHGLRWGHHVSMFQVWTDTALIANVMGELSPDGNVIDGTWSDNNRNCGLFSLTMYSPEDSESGDLVEASSNRLNTLFAGSHRRNDYKIKTGKWTVHTHEQDQTFDLIIGYKDPDIFHQEPDITTEPKTDLEQFCLMGTLQRHKTSQDFYSPHVMPVIGNVFSNCVSFSVMDGPMHNLIMHFMCEVLPNMTTKQDGFMLVEGARGFLLNKAGVFGSCIMTHNCSVVKTY